MASGTVMAGNECGPEVAQEQQNDKDYQNDRNYECEFHIRD